jgi:hypothetical protein
MQHVSDNTLVQVMPKDGWTTRPPRKGLETRTWPAKYVIYTHTAETTKCNDINECCSRLRNIQNLHMDYNSQ